jgi:hypothetical protein
VRNKSLTVGCYEPGLLQFYTTGIYNKKVAPPRFVKRIAQTVSKNYSSKLNIS